MVVAVTPLNERIGAVFLGLTIPFVLATLVVVLEQTLSTRGYETSVDMLSYAAMPVSVAPGRPSTPHVDSRDVRDQVSCSSGASCALQ